MKKTRQNTPMIAKSAEAAKAREYNSTMGGVAMAKMSRPETPEIQQHMLDDTRRGEKVLEFQHAMLERVIGQTAAVGSFVNAYQKFLIGMNAPNKPVYSVLLAGSTGIGKSHLCRAAADVLTGNDKALIKIDCGEFQHSHEISKLIGSPPGYIGHRETSPMLTQNRLSEYQTDSCKLSLVLFDEIEKASDALWNLLLGILDTASWTRGDNRTVTFEETVIAMTSNAGASDMNKLLSGGNIGFITEHGHPDHIADAAVRRKFTPEFINRLDEIVICRNLDNNDLHKIFEIEMRAVQKRILAARNCPLFVLSWTQTAADFIITKGTDPRYGARELKRTIEKLVVHKLLNFISSGQVDTGDTVVVDIISGELVFIHRLREPA